MAAPVMPQTNPIVLGMIEPFYWQIGPHQVLLNLLSNLDRRRFTPSVALPRPGQARDDFNGIRVSSSVVPGARNVRRRRAIAMAPELLASLLGGVQVRRFLKRSHAQLVHTNNEACWAGPIGARLAGLPSIVHVHGLGFTNSRFAATQLARLLNMTADRVIAVSSAVSRALEQAGVDQHKIRVVYNGIDTARFRPCTPDPELREEIGLKPNELAVGMFGGLDPRKGHRLFLKAAAMVLGSIPSTRFFIVGGDVPGSAVAPLVGYREELAGLAKRLGIEGRVHLKGERSDIAEFLSLMDVVVQPSETEAGPLVPLEAMGAGKPVVATNVGGNPEEVADGETGLIVPPGDDRVLADAIVALLSDPARRRQMGMAGRARVEDRFSAQRMTRDMESIYEEMVYGRVGNER